MSGPAGTPSDAHRLPRVGEVVGGKYRLERVLGEGGMGVVVAARHLELNEPVALKFLLPQMGERTDLVARFLREAQAAVRIKSEHVARVMDVGKLPSGAPYMVMEILEGTDLNRVLQQRGPLPIAEAADYILQACEGLAEAHALGIVHRDLKPGNLFLTRRADGSSLLKVLDFGISKVPRAGGDTASEESLTLSADILGSPAYMAPEQIRDSKGVDPRADIWALGVVLQRILTGKMPFGGDSPAAILANVIAEPPRPLRQDRPEVPPELDAVVLRCLEKSRDRRFADVAELAHALLPWAPSIARRYSLLSSPPPAPAPPGAISAATSQADAPTPAGLVTSPEPVRTPPADAAPATVLERSHGSRWTTARWAVLAGAALAGGGALALLMSRPAAVPGGAQGSMREGASSAPPSAGSSASATPNATAGTSAGSPAPAAASAIPATTVGAATAASASSSARARPPARRPTVDPLDDRQ